MRYTPTNTTCTGVSHTPTSQKHFHFNPSRTPVRNNITFRGEGTFPLARTFFPRRELRIRPKRIVIYSLDRETPALQLHKFDKAYLDGIAENLREEGFHAEAY